MTLAYATRAGNRLLLVSDTLVSRPIDGASKLSLPIFDVDISHDGRSELAYGLSSKQMLLGTTAIAFAGKRTHAYDVMSDLYREFKSNDGRLSFMHIATKLEDYIRESKSKDVAFLAVSTEDNERPIRAFGPAHAIHKSPDESIVAIGSGGRVIVNAKARYSKYSCRKSLDEKSIDQSDDSGNHDYIRALCTIGELSRLEARGGPTQEGWGGCWEISEAHAGDSAEPFLRHDGVIHAYWPVVSAVAVKPSQSVEAGHPCVGLCGVPSVVTTLSYYKDIGLLHSIRLFEGVEYERIYSLQPPYYLHSYELEVPHSELTSAAMHSWRHARTIFNHAYGHELKSSPTTILKLPVPFCEATDDMGIAFSMRRDEREFLRFNRCVEGWGRLAALVADSAGVECIHVGNTIFHPTAGWRHQRDAGRLNN